MIINNGYVTVLISLVFLLNESSHQLQGIGELLERILMLTLAVHVAVTRVLAGNGWLV